jgi:hypothetical protein
MATESVSQDGVGKEELLSALRAAQLAWGLDLASGKVDGSTSTEPMPSLNEDEFDEFATQAGRIFRHIIAGERTAPTPNDALTAAKNIARFPKQKKRGATVRTGPCAAILAFPVRPAPDRLTGEDLLSEWAWIEHHHQGWDDEELSGRSEKKEGQKFFFRKAAYASIKGHRLPDGDAIRKKIAKYRAIIDKRIRVKDWLETRGVNWDEVHTPEQALFFAFDRLHACDLPSSA